jgi:hypothetical protein
VRVIRLLWDSTEAYRAMYSTPPMSVASIEATTESSKPSASEPGDRLVTGLNRHRRRALDVARVLNDSGGTAGDRSAALVA